MTTYEANLEALALNHPELVALLGTDVPADHIQVVQARSGAARLLVTTESGVLAVHNADDPEAVAERAVEKLDLESGVTVLLGMGLGYLAKAIAARLKPGVALLIYEADPGVLKTALQLLDLTALLRSPRVKILVGPDARLESECYRFLLLTGGTVRVARAESAFRLAPALYKEKYEKELLPFIEGTLTNMFTVGRFGPLFTKNLLEAVPHIALSSGVVELRERFVSAPAILVAAGPSLEKNVRHLKEAKGRSVIICADTILGYLLERGIVPDFVVSVDGQARTYDKYENVDIPPDIALVYHPACNDSIFKHFPGPAFAMSVGMPAYQWLEYCWPAKGSIESDTQCQMHLGFNLAEWMGCDPIVIVGQDLCCTDNLMHVRGGSYLTPEEEARHVEKGHRMENIFGESVSAYPNFLIYKATFERKIRASRARCIHATEGGLKLEGAEIRRLADVIEEYCINRTVEVSSILRPLQDRIGTPDWEVLWEEVRGRERDLFRLERVSSRLCRMLDQIAAMREREVGVTRDLERLTQRTERLTALVPRYGKALGLMQLVDYGLELFMRQEDTGAIDQIENPDLRLNKQIERARRYYGSLKRLTPALREYVTRLRVRVEGVRRLKGAQADEGDAIQMSVDPAMLAERYEALELFTQAAGCVPDDPESERTAILTLRLLLASNQITRARAVASLVRDRFRANADLEALCRRAQEAWQAWQQRREAAMQSFDGRRAGELDAGDFYLRVKDYERAAAAYRLAADRQTADHEVRGEALYRMAHALRLQHQDEQAVKVLEETLAVAPSDLRIYFDLGAMALEQGLLVPAVRFFQKGEEISLGDPAFSEAAGAVLFAAGASREAVAFYERAIEKEPGNAAYLLGAARCYEDVFVEAHSA